MMKIKFQIVMILFFLIIMNSLHFSQKDSLPFYIDPSLFDAVQNKTLGLNYAEKSETFTVFSPKVNDNKYNHGVVLFPFKDYLYAQWQTSAKDEDAEDTYVVFSKSKDGKNWTQPEILAPKWNNGIYTSGGWWSYKDTLIAFINVWPEQNNKPRGGYSVYAISADGICWSEFKRLLDINGEQINGIIEQDVHSLPNGRIITAFHEQPGLIVSPYFTDDPKGLTGWTKGKMNNLPYNDFISREIEPSWFYQSDGNIVMIFRDQAGSFKVLASISKDNGETWTTPAITNMPDSRAKQCAGNLPNGTAYMVNNPSGNKSRIPLTITLSKDGKYFNKAFLLRSSKDLQPMKFEGKYKREGFSYPKSVIWKEHLYVSYATNKEDVEITRIPIKNVEIK